MAREQRRLAAIVAADVVGYSLLMGRDESGTLARLRAHRTDLIDPAIAAHGGRIVKTMGDGLLLEFPSAVEAIRCAIEVQIAMAMRNTDVPEGEHIVFRIGVNLGDIVIDGDDIHGDGVNVAARLEAEASAGGIVLAGAVHDAVSGRVKATFDDLGELSLKNIERPVRAYRVRVEGAAAPAPATVPAPADVPLALPDKPSIAVLPFQNMSGDPEQEYFADGMVEDIITALSRFKSLFVIARNSTFAYKGKAIDVRQVGRELGVRYVLEGSVRKAGDRLRITGQLVDGVSGAHLWADRFDGSLEDVFDLQDRVTASVVGVIAPAVQRAEIERMRRKPAVSLQAYDLVLRADALIRSGSRSDLEQAMRDLREVIRLDPNYAPGVARLAAACWVFVSQGYGHRDHPLAADMVQLARRALALDPTDSEVLVTAGFVIGLAGGDMPTGIELAENAMALNANNADAFRIGALLRGYLGEIDKTTAYLQHANQLNPLARRVANIGYVVASFGAGNHEAVVDWTARILRELPNYAAALRYRAASLALLGRLEEARQAVDRLLEGRPGYSIAEVRRHQEFDMNNPFKKPGVADSLNRGLRLAGLPE